MSYKLVYADLDALQIISICSNNSRSVPELNPDVSGQ